MAGCSAVHDAAVFTELHSWDFCGTAQLQLPEGVFLISPLFLPGSFSHLSIVWTYRGPAILC